MQRKDFLFEIGTEELPAKQLEHLQTMLKGELLKQLAQAQLSFEGAAQTFVTPRRLAILIPNLQTQQQDQIIERKGPSLAAAFDAEGKPTKACLGFAQSCDVSVELLNKRETEQGSFLFATKTEVGKSAQELLPELVQVALNACNQIAKPMHWGDNKGPFLRSVHWIILLLDNEVIPATFFDLPTGNVTYGHRFMSPQALTIAEPKNYLSSLQQAYVMANFAERKAFIEKNLNDAAKNLDGTVLMNEALLTEVTGLVEWPVILTGHFSKDFLSVPNNALIAAIESHQKSFAVVDQHGALMPYFLIVSNLVSKTPSKIIQGNERVMHARLSDAQFFYQQDCLIPLQNHCADLARVTFQAQLGSLQTKSLALAALAAEIATELSFDADAAHQAGLLAKCDLRTHMVGEFPELQGEMGAIYARKQGLPEAIANALREQYLPRFADDQLPISKTGIVLALADRLLNLVGLFGIGQAPTGSKDPFALRRAAIGVCRIIIENKLSLSLKPLLICTQSIWQAQGVNFDMEPVQDLVYDFIIERLRQEYINWGNQVVESVLCLGLDNLLDIVHRIQAVSEFKFLPEAKSLAAAEKRVRNLFQKENILIDALGMPDKKLFSLPEEHALTNAIIELQAITAQAVLQKDYAFILQETAKLKKPIDDFFAAVMVMAEDHTIRHNRLALLGQFSACANQVADIGKL